MSERKFTHTHQIIKKEKLICTNCGADLDGATGGINIPKPGDLSICFYCQQIGEFVFKDNLLAVEPFSQEKLESFKIDSPQFYANVMMIAEKIKRYKQ